MKGGDYVYLKFKHTRAQRDWWFDQQTPEKQRYLQKWGDRAYKVGEFIGRALGLRN